jgi:6-phosphofructokinase 1
MADPLPPDQNPTQHDFVLTSKPYAIVNQVYVAQVDSLRPHFTSFESGEKDYDGDDNDNGLVLVDTVRKPGMPNICRGFYRAGRRKWLHFDPRNVQAAIVTCGGLCPGLNNVVRELTRTLYSTQYQVKQVWGITGGWHGFVNPEYQPIALTKAWVETIHHSGGSALKTSRGGLDTNKVLQFLQDYQINQLYIIGGDGTLRAAHKVHEECSKQKLNIAVAGVPKTIDNDIDYLDRSFGFSTAVEAAQNSIRTALVEAKCTLPNGIGIIKLMGRSAGFLAAFAALGSGDVDAVLVPEVPIVLDGPRGILPHILRRVKEKQYAVIVVAEGAGGELLGETGAKEAGSGNKILPPIAEYIRDRVMEYFDQHGVQARMKFVDPSYSVRSVPANAMDSLYCTTLAHNAVHGCMSGLTGFSVGMVNNRTVYIPIPQLCATSPRSLDPHGPIWQRVKAMTGQPDPENLAVIPQQSNQEKEQKSGIEIQSFPRLPEPTVH